MPAMDNVLTLIADPAAARLDDSTLGAADQAIRAVGGTTSAPHWLDPGVACDLPFSGPDPAVAAEAVATRLGARSIDVAAMASVGRRKRLLLADMDSTIVTTETLDELAAAAG
ncbi:MAG: phosphoserine phosphatase SerB, partial [Alphaproteobacteria bacterium]